MARAGVGFSVKSTVDQAVRHLADSMKHHGRAAASEALNDVAGKGGEIEVVTGLSRLTNSPKINVRYRKTEVGAKGRRRGVLSKKRTKIIRATPEKPSAGVQVIEPSAPNIKNFNPSPKTPKKLESIPKKRGKGNQHKRRWKRKGVSAKYFGKRQQFKGAFWAPSAPGQQGIVWRRVKGAAKVTPTRGRYAGTEVKRQPIKPVFGPSFAVLLTKPIITRRVFKRVRQKFFPRMTHYLTRRLKNVEKRFKAK